MNQPNNTKPALPVHTVSPGDFIQAWLRENNVKATDLAPRLNITPEHLSELLSGKAPLSDTLSTALERVTGIRATLWNRTEEIYREELARMSERSDKVNS